MSVRMRQMAAVLLCHGDDWLMMKRADTRVLAPGLWAGVGGHLEPDELSDPERCAVREVEEETGIREDQIHDLRLQAILHRRRGQEIRLQYLYVGQALTRTVGVTEEGRLYWVPADQVLQKRMAVSTRAFLERYLVQGPSEAVWVGTLGNRGGEPDMHWAVVDDWEPL